MLHKCCNTDVLGVLLIYPHSPSGATHPRDRAYISVKPLAAVLQPYSILLPKAQSGVFLSPSDTCKYLGYLKLAQMHNGQSVT